MTPPIPSRRELRFAGFCYLAIIALGLFSEVFVRGSLVVAGVAVGESVTPAAQLKSAITLAIDEGTSAAASLPRGVSSRCRVARNTLRSAS